MDYFKIYLLNISKSKSSKNLSSQLEIKRRNMFTLLNGDIMFYSNITLSEQAEKVMGSDF